MTTIRLVISEPCVAEILERKENCAAKKSKSEHNWRKPGSSVAVDNLGNLPMEKYQPPPPPVRSRLCRLGLDAESGVSWWEPKGVPQKLVVANKY